MHTTIHLKGSGIRFCLLLILVISACGKKNQPTPEPPVDGGDKPGNSKNLLPVKLEHARLQISMTYLNNSSLLATIVQSDGLTEKFSYTDQQSLKSYERYNQNELVYMVDYAGDASGNVIKASQHLVTFNGKVTTPLGYYIIQLNTGKNITDVKWYNLSDRLLKTVLFNYSETGTINTMVNTSPEIKPISFSYDDKNGLFKNAVSCQFLALENPQPLFRSLKANILQQSGVSVPYQYSYTYNKDGYPVTILGKDEQGTQTSWKVTY